MTISDNGFNARQALWDIINGKSTLPFLIGAWQHLTEHEYGAENLAQAEIDYVRKWDWDWVKINPRAIYYSEAWGSEYDPSDYFQDYMPRPVRAAISSYEDLRDITVIDPESNPIFSEQIEAAKLIRKGLPDKPLFATAWSPLAVLLQSAFISTYPGVSYPGTQPSVTIDGLLRQHPNETTTALEHITETLERFITIILKPIEQGGAGFDGFFYTPTGTASTELVDPELYRKYALPLDRRLTRTIQDHHGLVFLHTCRTHSHPEWFAEFPVQILQWDPFAQGNPPLDAFSDSIPVGGGRSEDFSQNGNLERLRSDLKDSVVRLKGRPFLLGPSCGVPNPINEEAFHLLKSYQKNYR